MAKQEGFIAVFQQHKRWADIASIISTVLVMGLLCLASYLADMITVSETSRIGMYIAMVGVVIVVCIWQAAAMVAASVELAFRRRWDERGPWS
jgi:uncharacterized membrane protein (DUF485 family)